MVSSMATRTFLLVPEGEPSPTAPLTVSDVRGRLQPLVDGSCGPVAALDLGGAAYTYDAAAAMDTLLARAAEAGSLIDIQSLSLARIISSPASSSADAAARISALNAFTVLIDAVSQRVPTFLALDVSDNHLEATGASRVVDLLSGRGSSLHDGLFCRCALDAAAGRLLLPTLMPSSSSPAWSTTPLRVLRLDGNPLGDAGAVDVAALVARSPALLELSVSGCGFSSRGVSAVAAGMRKAPVKRLTSLSLSHNDFGGGGRDEEAANDSDHDQLLPGDVTDQCLADALAENPDLRSLDLSHMQLGRQPAACTEVLSAIGACCRALTAFNVAANRLPTSMGQALGAAISTQPQLSAFVAAHNPRLGSAGVAAVVANLTATTHDRLQTVDLADYGSGGDCAGGNTDDGAAEATRGTPSATTGTPDARVVRGRRRLSGVNGVGARAAAIDSIAAAMASSPVQPTPPQRRSGPYKPPAAAFDTPTTGDRDDTLSASTGGASPFVFGLSSPPPLTSVGPGVCDGRSGDADGGSTVDGASKAGVDPSASVACVDGSDSRTRLSDISRRVRGRLGAATGPPVLEEVATTAADAATPPLPRADVTPSTLSLADGLGADAAALRAGAPGPSEVPSASAEVQRQRCRQASLSLTPAGPAVTAANGGANDNLEGERQALLTSDGGTCRGCGSRATDEAAQAAGAASQDAVAAARAADVAAQAAVAVTPVADAVAPARGSRGDKAQDMVASTAAAADSQPRRRVAPIGAAWDAPPATAAPDVPAITVPDVPAVAVPDVPPEEIKTGMALTCFSATIALAGFLLLVMMWINHVIWDKRVFIDKHL
ncbi:hypothetical protein I4F81_007087 [Pyropia yezoensis]|uniref:Uncharacterized protein n=1 Tax=Pyropia yezoensis TaxID=2788 RepID=A0ACC3C2M5_PYRYE|nr:hypothetical protein I4F81_007087 [Neopyropia yezoensis]